MISVFFTLGQITGLISPTFNPLLARAPTATAETTNEVIWTVETGN